MPNSLEQLAASTKPEDFKIMMQFEGDPYRRSLLTRKGVFPYEYMDSFERFNEESLPPKEAFYSKLKMEGISDEDYEHAQRVWESLANVRPSRTTTTLYLSHRRRNTRRHLRELQGDMSQSLWFRPSALLHKPRSELGRAVKENRSQTRAPYRL